MSDEAPVRRTHWANVGEAGFAAGTWVLFFIHRVFGPWAFRVVLAPVVLLYAWRSDIARAASRDYFKHLGVEAGFWTTYRHILSFAETLMDKTLAVAGKYPFSSLEFVGREVMLESIERGIGGLVITSHMGCLEVVRLSAKRKNGPKLNVLVHTGNAEQFNAVLKRIDPESQITLIQVTEVGPATAAILSEKVSRGEFVVIAGDRVPVSDVSARTVPVQFLGDTAWFPIGPWVLANALKCQVVMLSVLKIGSRYRVRFEKLVDRVDLPRGRREEAAVGYAQQFATKLEDRVREAPFSWFNFFPFWEKPRA